MNSPHRSVLVRSCHLAGAVLGLVVAGGALAAAPRPNVLVILTDDMRWDAMGCAGHPFFRTPNLDRLAGEGARFANAFVTTSQDQGQQNQNPPQNQNTGKYRPLGSVTLGEVDDALRYYLPEIVPSPVEGWIARNYFCQLPVRQRTNGQSPVLFGRVKSCFPGDGNIQNIDQMELYFPNAGAGPDLLNVRRNDILGQQPLQSYCVGIKMYLSESELEDFRRSENIFIEKGFAPLYETGYLDLQETRGQEPSSLLWLHVIGSEWFAGIPDSVQPEIRERLRERAGWNLLLLNSSQALCPALSQPQR